MKQETQHSCKFFRTAIELHIKRWLCLILLSWLWLNTSAQLRYEAICYCISQDYSPSHILTLENNELIVTSLKYPLTLEELRLKGIQVQPHQLKLLLDWHILEKAGGDKYRASIPVFNISEAEHLRERSSRHSNELLNLIRADIQNLNNHLILMGYKTHTFTIFYSYILDSRIWHLLEEQNVINKYSIDDAIPHWNGELWLMEDSEPKAFESTTMLMWADDLSLTVSWNNDLSPIVQPLISNWESVTKIMSHHQEGSRVSDPSLREELGTYKIFDSREKLLLPVIDESNAQTEAVMNSISNKILNYLQQIDFTRVQAEFNLKSSQQACVILYREIIFELLNTIIKEGEVNIPKAIVNPAESKAGDLFDLMYLVRKRSKIN